MRLRRFASIVGGLLCSVSGISALADTPPLVAPERQGYAFEHPRVLAEQRLFGLAHGVALLADACRAVPAQAEATAAAYAAWRAQQGAQMDTLHHELAFFYYGEHADEADWKAVASALKLKQALDLAPDSETLLAACATLPQALQQPRYDLTALFQLEAALAAVSRATRIETLGVACGTQLDAAAQQALAMQLVTWHTREDAAATAAQVQMLRGWQQTQTPGEPGAWLAAQRQRYSNPPAATCAALADFLSTPAASLAQSFAMPPLPDGTALATTNDTNAPDPAERPLPPAEQAPSPIEDATPVEVDPAVAGSAAIPNLFELLMRLVNEQSRPTDIADPADPADSGN